MHLMVIIVSLLVYGGPLSSSSPYNAFGFLPRSFGYAPHRQRDMFRYGMSPVRRGTLQAQSFSQGSNTRYGNNQGSLTGYGNNQGSFTGYGNNQGSLTGYGTNQQGEAPQNFFPKNVRDLFAFKTYISSTKTRLENGETLLAAIKAEIPNCEAKLDPLPMALRKLFNSNKQCQAQTTGAFNCDFRCYSFSSTALSFQAARDDCLILGGKLAEPRMDSNAQFGHCLDVEGLTVSDNYWIGGTSGSADYTLFNGYIVVANGPRFTGTAAVGNGMTVVVPAKRDDTWVVSSSDPAGTLNYICEFKPLYG